MLRYRIFFIVFHKKKYYSRETNNLIRWNKTLIASSNNRVFKKELYFKVPKNKQNSMLIYKKNLNL